MQLLDGAKRRQLLDRYVPPANPLISDTVPPDLEVKLTYKPYLGNLHFKRIAETAKTECHETVKPYSQDQSLGTYFATKRVLFARESGRPGPRIADYAPPGKEAVVGRTIEEEVEKELGRGGLQGERFFSSFQCGNLLMAFERGVRDYELLLQNDVGSRGYTQWFCFAVGGLRPGMRYTFRIVNLVKAKSLFERGMKPAVFSFREHSKTGCRWSRPDCETEYYSNGVLREGQSCSYFTLKFTYDCKHDRDTVIFAHSFPYTYDRLQKCLARAAHSTVPYKIQTYTTPLGLALPVISLGNPLKETVLVIARQHPGQTPGSFVMEGILNVLFDNSYLARSLRQSFRFLLVPMANPDGVFLGNSRCNSMGIDFNRRWNKPHSFRTPQVRWLKQQLSRQKETHNFRYIFDLHGHSRKLSSFFFANSEASRLLPYLVSKHCKFVSYSDTQFLGTLRKKQTARVELAQALSCEQSFTLQSSFFGYKQLGKIKQYTLANLKQIGKQLLISILDVSGAEKSKLSLKPWLSNDTLSRASSDSDPDCDLLNDDQFQILKSVPAHCPRPSPAKDSANPLSRSQKKRTKLHYELNIKARPNSKQVVSCTDFTNSGRIQPRREFRKLLHIVSLTKTGLQSREATRHKLGSRKVIAINIDLPRSP